MLWGLSKRRQRDQYTEACHSVINFHEHKLQNNVALLVLLVPKHADAAGPPILVANTHCLFNPKRGDIKVDLGPMAQGLRVLRLGWHQQGIDCCLRIHHACSPSGAYGRPVIRGPITCGAP